MEITIRSVLEVTGLTSVANSCGVCPSAVYRWKALNRLPRTEFTGETVYAPVIARLYGRGVTADELLEASKVYGKKGRRQSFDS